MFRGKYVLLAVIVVLLLSGCTFNLTSGKKVVYDPNLPKKEGTQVTFGQSIQVQQYNGIDVVDEWYKNRGRREVIATLPGGSSTILLNWSAAYTSGTRRWELGRNNVEFQYAFEPRKKYFVGTYVEEKKTLGLITTGGEAGIAIWAKDKPGKKSNAVKYWALQDF